MQKQYIRTYLNNKFLAYLTAAAFLLLAMLMGISIGTVSVHPMTIIRVISAELFPFISLGNTDAMHSNIILNIRLPRVLLAGLVGASLAIAGAAFQGLLRNPLADPYTIGVSSGASLGAVLTLFLGLSIPFAGMFTLPLFSILFSFLTIFAVLLFARKIERSMKVETIILTGIIFSSFLGALISLMIALTGEELRQIIGWLLGSVSMRGWAYIKIIIPFFVLGAILLLVNSKELNAMSFGEEKAQHIGVDVQKRKMMVLIAGSILTGAAVAVSGTIGFVGLVIPHLTRLLWGPDHRHLLPLSILMGAGFLIIADLVSRTIIAPTELPIGVITAIIGAPAFAIILIKRKNKL
ncbi:MULTISPECIES: FecCD family ABC transporter permease [Cytobacillus]|uniref:ABC transporter permease n=2 Tax=Cytobacillus oceanisediminis TaxID=665099 RepID=A0A160M669_9BACI|nr:MULTISPECIES: iron chelate uptake ABC transporter family permease subunit [Cytobacillus]EFV74381.1 ferric ion ABC transporter [Bacillus sp. 2_A_57_CT2]MBY0157901.1 iron ABC transporter permease [Cytobacillus firmus]AND37852.1 ABC transporter permease [Cytobacillus oceanisediminis 2691]MBU8732606.1 iron ABC transporter permease [Cytobacillus oceanisediminis]MCM3395426.1 iron ABC transporter permease [Cytobacillus oceanisediminis]